MARRKHRKPAEKRLGQVGTRDLPQFLANLRDRVSHITKKDRERWNPKRSLVDLRSHVRVVRQLREG